MNEETLFARAVQLAAEQRAAFLDRECSDPVMRARVEALLAADAASVSPLDASPAGPLDVPLAGPPAGRDGAGEPDATRTFQPSPSTRSSSRTSSTSGAGATRTFQPSPSTEEAAGVIIAGRYKLRQQIGEGGMGTVWMADQTEPVKRQVAVKLIRVDRGQSKTILARFEAERQAIALMDHPHIARLLDAGTTEAGSPFFVMELVKGLPLNEFCDQHKLTIPERLNLFMQVCLAVQHAHQKGIIHRDLKPSNILVESHDGKPVPKVIDFGLAKATTGLQLTEQSLFTGFGTVLGTPLYMAPEQASFNAVDIDTRADVYALGVVLYELLTGSTPLSKETLRKAALDEMLKLIREQEAPTPSSRLSSAESTPSVAASRQTEPAKLGRFVKGELDWIALKALAKDRDRRYETANGFAKDIERFLNHEPLQAGPPSVSYRLTKFVRRNRPQVIAASLVLLSLVAGVIGTSLALLEAKRQERAAVVAREAEAERAEGERQAKELAEIKRQEAEAQQQRAEAGEKLASERLLQVEAEKQRADEEKQIAEAVNDFLQTKLLAQADTTAQADELLRGRGGLAAEAKYNPTVKELLDRAAAELAPDKIEANFPQQPLVQAQILRTVGDAYRGIGEAAIGIPFLTRSVDLYRAKLGPDHLETLMSMNNLSVCYQAAGKLDQALSLCEETLKIRKAKLGPDHPNTLVSMNNLATGYYFAGKLDQALPLYEESLELCQAKLGPDHPTTLAGMNNLAEVYRDAGKVDQALPLLEEALKRRKAKLGADHPDTLTIMNNLANGYSDAGKIDQALLLYDETLKLSKSKLGPDHPDTLTIMNNLALCYGAAGELDQALPLLEETLRLSQAKLGTDHPDTLNSMYNLASGYQAAGKLDQALPLLEETLRLSQAKLGPDHPDTLASMGNLGSAYCDANQGDRAADTLTAFVAGMKPKYRPGSPQFAGLLSQVSLALLGCDQFASAEVMLRECLEIREQVEPDAWTTFNTQSLLGAALLGQEMYVDAEPLLLKGYDGMKAREATIPPQATNCIPETLDLLIELYVATDRTDEAQKYRDLRMKYPMPEETAPLP